jgi:hypothetical protein
MERCFAGDAEEGLEDASAEADEGAALLPEEDAGGAEVAELPEVQAVRVRMSAPINSSDTNFLMFAS